MNTAIIFNDDLESKIALMYKGILYKLIIERKKEKSYLGKIVKARIEKILKNLNVAFLDIGDDTKLFLDINNFNKNDIIANKEILVKIIEDKDNNKQMKCTTECVLSGKYLNYIPNSKVFTFSKKIKDTNFKKHIYPSLKNILEKNEGVIIRNFAQNTAEENIISELKFLKNEWSKISEKFLHAKVGDIIFSEDIFQKFLKDYDIEKFDEIYVDNEKNYNEILSAHSVFLKNEDSKKFKIFRKEENVFCYFGIDKEIERSLKSRVDLSCGGNILIEKTEAFTSIDVNSANLKNSSVFEVNLEAAKVIANQIMLRNISGIIVIDFITTNNTKHKNKIKKIFLSEMSKDNLSIDNLSFDNLDLLIFTRKKTDKELFKYFLKDEKGNEFSCEYISLKIAREILENSDENIKVIEICTNENIISDIKKLYLNYLENILKKKNKKLIFKKNNDKKNYEINFFV